MGDDNATRQRRKRAHARGDHSLCRPGACRARDVQRAEAGAVVIAAEGDVSPAPPSDVLAALAAFRPALVDCAACNIIMAACESLSGHDHPLQPAVVAQLRACVVQMAACEHDASSPLDSLKASRQAGRMLALVERLG